jgi:sugar phosphate isomerase/epimerase
LQGDKKNNDMLFAKNNLLAWCIVPYDSKKRSSEERALMLKELGITSMAYDMRDADLPNMENEFTTLKKYNINITAVWFWINGDKEQLLNNANEIILKSLAKTGTKTELWVCFPNKFFEGLTDEEKVQKGAKAIQYIHKRAAEIGCTIALYNHKDWFGEPANQVKIIEVTGLKDIHIVYNFHHGHEQVDKLDDILKVAQPYLTTVNLNGMKGTTFNILTICQGDHELDMLKKLKKSGYNGYIGIIGHTDNEDVKLVLQRNIEGLKQLLAKMGETKALKTYE